MSLPPFQRVLDEHRAAVHRFLVAAVGRDDADDCFQETFLAALRAYPRLERADNLRAWLLRIAERKALDHHRARVRRALPSEALPEQAVDGTFPAGDDEPQLWAQVRALPPKQRAAVFFRCVAGTSYAELADALDCSREAARRNVHEGLKRLREGATEWSASSVS